MPFSVENEFEGSTVRANDLDQPSECVIAVLFRVSLREFAAGQAILIVPGEKGHWPYCVDNCQFSMISRVVIPNDIASRKGSLNHIAARIVRKMIARLKRCCYRGQVTEFIKGTCPRRPGAIGRGFFSADQVCNDTVLTAFGAPNMRRTRMIAVLDRDG